MPGGHFSTYTLLTALRLRGPIQPATVLIDGTVNACVFRQYIEHMLAAVLERGDIVVMDNLSAHKGAAIGEAIQARRARLVYLPPYSPDLNPIEKLFSKLKAALRKACARTYPTLARATRMVLRSVTPLECLHYFRSCGYALSSVKTL